MTDRGEVKTSPFFIFLFLTLEKDYPHPFGFGMVP